MSKTVEHTVKRILFSPVLVLCLSAWLQGCGATSPRITSGLVSTNIRLQQVRSSHIETLRLPEDLSTDPLPLGLVTDYDTIADNSCLLVGASGSSLMFEVLEGDRQGSLILPHDSIRALLINEKARYRLGLRETGGQMIGNAFGGIGAFSTLMSPLLSLGLWTGLSSSYGDRLLTIGGSSIGVMGLGLGIRAISTARRQTMYVVVSR